MTVEYYHNLVIGSGEAAKYLAWNLAKMGQEIVVVERSMIGSSYPNSACLPKWENIYVHNFNCPLMQKTSFNPLTSEFYIRTDVVQVARDLLGKVLYTSFNHEITAGIIIETEAYAGVTDKASHAYNNRRTVRTVIMYRTGGTAYVYLCYGVHSLFNIVTSIESDPHAVLIRGIEPLHGIEIMKLRTGKSSLTSKNGIGPGNISKLLGIKVAHSGADLCPGSINEGIIWVQDEKIIVPVEEIVSGPRIGVDYAGEDALLPYRFQWLKNKKAPR